MIRPTLIIEKPIMVHPWGCSITKRGFSLIPQNSHLPRIPLSRLKEADVPDLTA